MYQFIIFIVRCQLARLSVMCCCVVSVCICFPLCLFAHAQLLSSRLTEGNETLQLSLLCLTTCLHFVCIVLFCLIIIPRNMYSMREQLLITRSSHGGSATIWSRSHTKPPFLNINVASTKHVVILRHMLQMGNGAFHTQQSKCLPAEHVTPTTLIVAGFVRLCKTT